jgi:hypothetical protein
MIKKTTLFVLLGAILLGAAVYFFDWRRSQKESEKPSADADKLAFSIQPQDVTSLVLSRPANPAEPALRIEKRNGVWEIVQPMETQADEPSLEGIVDSLAGARISQTEPGTPDRLKVFGLDPPAVSLEFQTQNGSKHTLQMGNKDFTQTLAYSIVDGGKTVDLLPESLLISLSKSLQDLRDQNVLHIVSGQVASFSLKNSSGLLEAKKEKNGWEFTNPKGALADDGSVSSLLSSISSAKMSAISSETPDNLAKYGLASPAVSFTATDEKGKASTLIVGKKDGAEYFARDSSRPMIFRINEPLYKKLSENYSDLRDKKVVHYDSAAITHVEMHNASGTIAVTRKSESEWTADEPADVKGKSADISRVFSALDQARASEIFDHPASGIAATLVKPAVEITLTAKDGRKLTVVISKESEGFVYARTSDGPAVYKLNKQILDDLNFKPSEIVF